MWELRASTSESADLQSQVRSAYQNFLNKKELGFKEISRFEDAIIECEKNLKFFESKKSIVVIGLGGSSLGAKAVCEALYPGQWQHKIHFLDNVDVHTIDRFLESVDSYENIGWILGSKSGSTIEVQSLYDYCFEYVQAVHSYSIVANTIVITEDKKSPLYDFAQANNCSRLSIPFDVGGRFSIFTAVGLFPLSFLGFDFKKAYKGFQSVLNNKLAVETLASQLYFSYQRGEVNFYSFQYCDRLTYWSAWLQQLWSESLAKAQTTKGDKAPINSTFIPCRGASDQHSVLQQVIEGQEKKFVCFHRVETSEKSKMTIKKSVLGHQIMEGKNLGELLEAEATATEQAVQESGTATIVLKTLDLDEESMAYLMGLWMLTVGVMGELFEIDAFNQPGVESGKVIARRVLSQSN